jgi:uncharacterized membrane protein
VQANVSLAVCLANHKFTSLGIGLFPERAHGDCCSDRLSDCAMGALTEDEDYHVEYSLDVAKAHRAIRNSRVRIRRSFPIRLAAGLLLAILIDTAVQLVWKSVIQSLPDDGSPWINVQAILHSPLAIFVIFLMACQFANWLTVLKNADLSYAQPVSSLSYVSVFCLSVLYLKEATDLIQIAGIIFVLVGVWFISQTDHVTRSKELEA